MCGIVGVVSANSLDNLIKSKDTLLPMRDILAHRGPDDTGLYLKDNVFLGHRRLSIIDIAGGKQPMTNEDASLIIAYNGEIYNFKELKGELESVGHKFKTHSDTEVVIHCYEEYGEECVNKFIGMFAFAIWDVKKQRLFLARDHFGIKPLYYAVVKNKIIFASELKSILLYPGMERKIDLKAMAQYFMFEYVPEPLTIFEGIYKLEPASSLTYYKGNVNTKKYWRIELNPLVDIREAEAKERLLMHLRRSVSRCMVSDVPVGVLLSGGIDSSTIFALMNEITPGNIRSFTIGFEEESFDESDYARSLAKHFLSYHHEFRIRPHQLIEYIPNMVKALDEPFGDSAIIITNFLHTMTSRHVKVVMGGEGGDELFAGYQHIIAHKFANFLKGVPKTLVEKALKPLVNNLPVAYDYFSFEFKAKKFISGLSYTPAERNQVWLGSYSPAEQKKLFSGDLYEKVKGINVFEPIYNVVGKTNMTDLLTQILMIDFNLYLPGDILTLTDRASMATSLEVRVPFLDRELVEFVTNLPMRFKLGKFTSKYLLRKSMEGILPNNITKRKKVGLNIPASRWLKEELRDFVRDTLSESFIKKQNMFDYSYIDKLLDGHLKGLRDNRKQIWTLMMFVLWYKEYMGKS